MFFSLKALKALVYAIFFHSIFILFVGILIPILTLLLLLLSPFCIAYLFKAYVLTNDNKSENYIILPRLDQITCNEIESYLLDAKNVKYSDTLNDNTIKFISDWQTIDIEICHTSNSAIYKSIELHSIIAIHQANVSSTKICKKPSLIWLHGVGGSALLSLILSGIVDRVASQYDAVYAIDLPGMGRSITPRECRSMTG